MGVLSGPEIVRLVGLTRDDPDRVPGIEIHPFDVSLAGPNSYDLHLGDTLRVYDLPHPGLSPLDPRKDNPTRAVPIPPEGTVLYPGTLYLGATVERIRAAGLVPWVNGRSSVGRLGLFVHVTAGWGDDEFHGNYTLELMCVHPIRIYAGMRVGQIAFHELVGTRKPYAGRYSGAAAVGPVASRFHAGEGPGGSLSSSQCKEDA